MGLLEDLAAAAIRNQVLATLRAGCPAELKAALETLLADKAAVAAVQKLVMGAMKNPELLTSDAVAALPFSDEIRSLIAAEPALTEYLVQTAKAKLKR